MSEIKHDITINAAADTVYDALATKEGIQSWFTAQVKGSGNVNTDWLLTFTDQPTFTWRILAADKPHAVTWECLEGPGNAAGTQVTFTLISVANNKTTLTIAHRGWTENDPKFERCVEIWRTLMNHLQSYCETGVAEPAYQ